MIDLDTTLYAISTDDEDTQLEVRILERGLGGDFPILALVGEDLEDPDDQTVVRFSLTGESRKGKYTLCNPEAETANDAGDCDACGKVALPAFLNVRVRHARYGTGTVLKVRSQEGKALYVDFGDAGKRWCFDRKLQAA